MRKIRKKLLAVTMAALILVSSGISGIAPIVANAAGNPGGTNNDHDSQFDRDPRPPDVEQAPWIDVKRKAYNENTSDGIIMKDAHVSKYSPSNFGYGQWLADAKPSDHTGWSVEGNVCERYISDYEEITNSEGEVTGYKPIYTSVWHLGRDGAYPGVYQYNTFNQNDDGQLAQYIDQLNSKYSHLGIANWAGVRGGLWGVGYWNILSIMPQANHPCQNGNTSFAYTDNDIVMEGRVQVDRKDPTEIKPSTGRDEGDVKGAAHWELVRHNTNANSGVDAYMNLVVTGDHYAFRNVSQTLNIGGQSKSGKTELKIRIPDGMNVKNQDMKYSFTYEYTNFYKDIYKCTDREAGYCYEWVFVERVPEWSKGKTFNYSNSSKIDHRMKDVVTGAKIEDLFTNYKVGNKEDIQNKSSKQSTPYYETFKKASGNTNKSHYDLKTQTPIPINPGKLAYGVTVPSGSHSNGGFEVLRKEGTYGHMYPPDVDDSLKADYSNNTSISGYSYAIPYQQSSLSGSGGNLEWNYVSDLFFMTQHTGFQQGFKYAEKAKQNYTASKSPPPTYNSFIASEGVESKIKAAFTASTGQVYMDNIMYINSPNDKLQRYAIPVSAKSPLKPKTNYQNHNAMHNMGLNDLSFRYNQTFKFDRYLFGSGADDAWIIEQVDSMTRMDDINPSDVNVIKIPFEKAVTLAKEKDDRTKTKMHEFRTSDRNFKDRVKQLLGY